jgi:hypothetical protein
MTQERLTFSSNFLINVGLLSLFFGASLLEILAELVSLLMLDQHETRFPNLKIKLFMCRKFIERSLSAIIIV